MLMKRLSSTEKPDFIGITSGMTYWYPGLFKTIQMVKSYFNDTPVILGGIYATLCYDHAVQFSGADFVIQGSGETELINILSRFYGLNKSLDLESRAPSAERRTAYPPYPCYDLYPQLDFVSMSTSKGCPFHCSYCASQIIDKGYFKRDPQDVVDEINYWTTRYGVQHIAFYDDALLIESRTHLVPILEEILRKGLRCDFHVPNGLHVREINAEVADLLFRTRFKTIRLGFETSNEREQTETGGKVTNQEFQVAIRNLRKAGYFPQEIGVYLLVGLPGQRVNEVEESIAFSQELGVRPMLVEYSPVPGTPIFKKAMKLSSFDIQNEPLFHNNSILPCQWEGFSLTDYGKLKEKANKGLYT